MQTHCPKTGINYFIKGETAGEYQPGDFILVSNDTFFSRLIKLGQRIRSPRSVYNKWCHAAIIVTPSGDLIEANGREVVKTTLEAYKDKDYLLVRIEACTEDRHEAVTFAHACVGEKYGWFTILSIAGSLLTGLKFSFGVDGQEICSGLVARSLERTSALFPRDPSHITPSELACYYLEQPTLSHLDPLSEESGTEASQTPSVQPVSQ